MMGNMTDCNFYVLDATGDTTGLSFRVAYIGAKQYRSGNNKDLCDCVGSLLCSVVPGFRNSVEAALNGIGARPRFVSLPSQQAHQKDIVMSDVLELDWSSILVVFGYFILLLFQMDSELFGLRTFVTESPHSKRIEELLTKVGCPRSYMSGIPFKQKSENVIRTMLGTHALRTSVINFLMNNFNHPDPQICIKTKSPVLSDSRVLAEVENLEELIKAILSHTYPQYFNHLCLTSELFYLDVLRFPNLFSVAQVLDDVYNSQVISGASYKTVEELVKLHRTAMIENRVTTVRRMPTWFLKRIRMAGLAMSCLFFRSG
ncbi:hypothetical protein MtrunA17_Chr2g0293771 [Medicago truncatula]|uniref:Uncharacterized protein n=1 Tax=Medicago truncatula TaxID=3880 RepID=A0A396J4Y4_MEDTR|nr:hypothetical protein MtrunA17_Chr2g0293771 [Medicago truncatula]